jgi:hypothetical protein
VTTIRTLAFVAPDASSWGAAWLPQDRRSLSLAYRIGSSETIAEAELRASGQAEPWQIEGDGVSLVFTPAGADGQGGSADAGVGSFDQLCSVHGQIPLDGSQREIECMGWRSSVEGSFELSEIDSFRETSGWFEPARGLSLLAFRPRKAQGQDADLVAASLLEPEPMPRVADPRLSTTYDARGLPTRIGLELWLESESSDEDPDDDYDHQIPRRAAGEPVGAGIDWEVSGFRLHAALVRWHSRGEDGSGVYLLGQRE